MLGGLYEFSKPEYGAGFCVSTNQMIASCAKCRLVRSGHLESKGPGL